MSSEGATLGVDNYDWVILGDEPAGVWLARELALHFAERGEPTRIACIGLKDGRHPVPLARPIADAFRIPIERPFSPEIVTPHRSIPWRDETLREKFPELPPRPAAPEIAAAIGRPSSAQLSAARQAVRRHPELLGFSAGLWKILGRTHHLQPETLLLGSLLATELSWWEPHLALPEVVTKLTIDPKTQPIDEVIPARDALTLTFRGMPAITARRWILNLSGHRLRALGAELPKLLNPTDELRSQNALFPLRLRVADDAIPCAVGPITIALDTEDIPEVDSETWPIVLRPGAEPHEKRLTLWVSARREIALEATADAMRAGLKRLYRLFPFLPTRLISTGLPLDAGSCLGDEARAALMEDLERESLETYDLTSFHHQTRHPSLIALFPHLHCHLPYPLGPLTAARGMLTELQKKKRKKPPAATVSVPAR